MQPQNNNQFYFLNQNQANSQGPLGSLKAGGKNIKSRLIIVGVGLLFLIIIIIIALSIISSAGKANNKNFINIVEDQSILLDITNQGIASSTDLSTTNSSSTINVVLTSEQSQIISVLSKNGLAINKKQSEYKSVVLDNSLVTAKSNGTFQSTYISSLQDRLKIYQKNINLAYKGAKNKSEKTILNSLYDDSTKFVTATSSLPTN